jgi:aryl carrier-like protein
VKWRGFRIELGELEDSLGRHPGVRAAVGALHEDAGLIAYVVAGDSALTAEALAAFLKGQLPEYMLPSQFVFLDSLPLTPNGKLNRRALPQPTRQERLSSTKQVAPRTYLEREIAAAWMEVLHLEQVGVHDNFFDLGGHSLRVIQVLSRLRNSLDVDVPIRRVFEGPTIAEMAEAVLLTLAEHLSDEEYSEVLQEDLLHR